MEKKIGVIHYNFGGVPIEDFLSWCRENEVKYVELRRSDIEEENLIMEDKAEKVARLLEKFNVKVSQLAAGNDFVQPSDETLYAQVKMIGKLCKVIKILDVNQLRIDGGWPKEGVPENKFKDLVIHGIEKSLEFAEKEDVYFALDNHGEITNNYLFQLEIFEKIKSRRLGANLDTMNYRWYGYEIEELTKIYKEIAPYTLHTHLKDGTGIKPNYKGKVLGEGEVPINEAIKILKDAGYKGVWCIEYEGKDNKDGYKKCVEWLKENLEKI